MAGLNKYANHAHPEQVRVTESHSDNWSEHELPLLGVSFLIVTGQSTGRQLK